MKISRENDTITLNGENRLMFIRGGETGITFNADCLNVHAEKFYLYGVGKGIIDRLKAIWALWKYLRRTDYPKDPARYATGVKVDSRLLSFYQTSEGVRWRGVPQF